MARRTKTDPTGQAANRKQTAQRLTARLKRAKRTVIDLFAVVPRIRRSETIINNASTVVYDYSLTPEQLEALQIEVRAALDSELETQGETVPPAWWYQPEVELPSRQGTLDELTRFNQLIAAAVAAGVVTRGGLEPQRIAAETVLNSGPYLQQLRQVYVENYGTIKSLSTRTADQVNRVLNNGIRAGLKPSEVAAQIVERFDVAQSGAQRIADTEINQAYNNARLRAVELAADLSDLQAGVLHVSALISKTRPSHAARHGNAYTVTAQRQWWDSDANRINCHCSVESVLIDANGDVVQKSEQARLKGERMPGS